MRPGPSSTCTTIPGGDRYRGRAICRNPWIVTAFLNGIVAAARRNRDTGLWEDVYAAGWSDMAVVRSLRDGHERQVAVGSLILHDDEGLVRQPSLYPTLPDMRLWRVGQPALSEPQTRKGPSCLTPPTRIQARNRLGAAEAA